MLCYVHILEMSIYKLTCPDIHTNINIFNQTSTYTHSYQCIHIYIHTHQYNYMLNVLEVVLCESAVSHTTSVSHRCSAVLFTSLSFPLIFLPSSLLSFTIHSLLIIQSVNRAHSRFYQCVWESAILHALYVAYHSAAATFFHPIFMLLIL